MGCRFARRQVLHCIASHRIASHRIASHRIASHRIAPHRIARAQLLPKCLARGAAGDAARSQLSRAPSLPCAGSGGIRVLGPSRRALTLVRGGIVCMYRPFLAHLGCCAEFSPTRMWPSPAYEALMCQCVAVFPPEDACYSSVSEVSTTNPNQVILYIPLAWADGAGE